MSRARRWDAPWDTFPPSRPLPAEGGIATRRQRGAMAASWWSQRFVEVLESYGLGTRMQRGRRYARQGQVLDVDVTPGLTVLRGRPKRLFRPGSSVVVLFFQKDRIHFDPDLVANQRRCDVASRFSFNFGAPVVETDIQVRASLARRGPGPEPTWLHGVPGAADEARPQACPT